MRAYRRDVARDCQPTLARGGPRSHAPGEGLVITAAGNDFYQPPIPRSGRTPTWISRQFLDCRWVSPPIARPGRQLAVAATRAASSHAPGARFGLPDGRWARRLRFKSQSQEYGDITARTARFFDGVCRLARHWRRVAGPKPGEDVMKFDAYLTNGFYDEMFDAAGQPRRRAEMLARRLMALSDGELVRRQKAADLALLNMGITFNVYGHEAGTEKVWPFDIVPRIIDGAEWDHIERGLKQRIRALNLFIDDVYNKGRIIQDGVVPDWLISSGKCLLSKCTGLRPPHGIWCHITGTDLVRDSDGEFYVLEDNLRCPSGVSYVLENREVMKRTFPQIFGGSSILPVENYTEQLLQMLQFIAPPDVENPNVVVLTPGVFNSAYFEHCFLAQQMGVELVQGSDLLVMDGYVFMRTTQGFERVDVIYRRIDDDFLDPEVFRPDSALGVPGLMDVYRAGRVALANAPGTGIADDKAVYAYVPQMIKYYLGEETILSNVPTFVCGDPQQCEHVLLNIDKLVIKPTNESGGYGILLGPQASTAEHQKYRDLIRANPRNYVAQPMLSLSQVPTVIDDQLEGRHVDLRPYVLYGQDIYVLPGGLTRVALKKGSLVVNSSQGGGSKDTWVLKNGVLN
jgi:uncharacterized circularly permuted ATP-grasp superfamily protein